MNKATPHQHGHETDAHAGRGSHEEHGKASAEHVTASHPLHFSQRRLRTCNPCHAEHE